MTKKEKARFICGKLSLVFTLLAVLLTIFVFCYGSIVSPKTASASTFDTLSYLQAFEQAARQDPDFSPDYPFSTTDAYHTLFRGMPDKYVGKAATGSNKSKTSSTFDFSATVTNYSYPVASGGTKFYYFKSLTIENPYSVANIPYLWFMPDHGSNMDSSGTGADWLLLLDTLADGSKVFRFIGIFTNIAKVDNVDASSSVWYQTSWSVDDTFVPFVDGTTTDTSWFQVTGKLLDSASDFENWATANSREYDSFDCYSTSDSLFSLVALYPDKNVVKREYTGIFRGDFRYRFYDEVYADSASNYYNSLFSKLSGDFSRNYTENVDFAKSVIKPYQDRADISDADFKALKEQYDFYRNQVETLNAQISSLNYQLSALQSDLDDMTTDRDSWKHKYMLALAQGVEVEKNLSELQSSYDTLNASYTSLNETYQSLSSSNSQLQSNYETLKASDAELQTSNAALQKSFSELQDKYNALTKDHATWEEKYAQSYNNGYNQGVSDTKAMNNILTVVPESVVSIWNGVLAPIFRYDVFGISIGSIFAGLICLGGVFLIITKVL